MKLAAVCFCSSNGAPWSIHCDLHCDKTIVVFYGILYR